MLLSGKLIREFIDLLTICLHRVARVLNLSSHICESVIILFNFARIIFNGSNEILSAILELVSSIIGTIDMRGHIIEI